MNLANEAYWGQSAHPWVTRFFVVGCILIVMSLSYAMTSARELANTLTRVENGEIYTY